MLGTRLLVTDMPPPPPCLLSLGLWYHSYPSILGGIFVLVSTIIAMFVSSVLVWFPGLPRSLEPEAEDTSAALWCGESQTHHPSGKLSQADDVTLIDENPRLTTRVVHFPRPMTSR